jgi:acetyl esterase/lipase
VRVCLSCASDSSRGSVDLSRNTDICLICRSATNFLSEALIKSVIGPNVPVAWHKSCAKCRSCGVLKTLGELQVSPPIGSIIYTLPDIHVHCYCDAHVSDMNSMVSASQNSDVNTINSITSDKEPPAASQKIAYGPSDSQYFKLFIPVEAVQDAAVRTDVTRSISSVSTPSQSGRSVPIAVIVHGGFWKAKYGIDNAAIDTLTPSLLYSGMAVCLIEYRRIGSTNPEDEGGWPGTNEDILQALRKLHQVVSDLQDEPSLSGPVPMPQAKQRARIDMDRAVLIGHSAGGYLALWSCCRSDSRLLPFKPILCVAIAPVCDLSEACRRR